MAADAISLEKSNALASSIEIDDSRTTQITNSHGIATFNLKVLRGRNGIDISVICEAKGVKSPLSRKIRLNNPISFLKVDDEIKEDIDIDFERNA